MTDPTAFAPPIAAAASRKRVHPTDRLWDIAALLFVICGVGVFFYGRSAITAIADGTYSVPDGMSHVAMTELRVAQTRLGIWLVAVGITSGVVAALKHRFRRS